MAGNFGGSSEDDVIAGINITPLVDVVLVLLIIFMITAPMLYQSAIHVQLPQASSGEQSEKGSLSFSLSKEGTLTWNDRTVNWKELSTQLKQRHSASSTEAAIISADEFTPHGTVIRLMDILREAGLSRIALNVSQAPKTN